MEIREDDLCRKITLKVQRFDHQECQTGKTGLSSIYVPRQMDLCKSISSDGVVVGLPLTYLHRQRHT